MNVRTRLKSQFRDRLCCLEWLLRLTRFLLYPVASQQLVLLYQLPFSLASLRIRLGLSVGSDLLSCTLRLVGFFSCFGLFGDTVSLCCS